MRRLIRRLTPFAALIVVLFAAFPPEVRAHGYLVRAIPDNRAVLERAPVRVQYWFSESLEPAFSSITIRDAAGGEIAAGGVDARDPRLLTTRLPIGLPDGVYSVDLRLAFASDGHVIAERRAFFVGASGAFAGIEAQTSAVPLEIAWRALVLIGTTLLFGIYGTYALVFIPAWGNTAHPAGNLPPRVMRRVHRIAGLALGMALVGNLIALMQQSMVYFDADIGRVLSENLWSVVRTSTRFGDTWNARMALLALIAALHAAALSVRASQPPLVRAFLTANLWALPPLILTWSVSAHAAGSPILPWAALISDWLHGVGVGLWAGGVAALALILPVALQPYVADERAAIMRAALRRFSPLALACVAVVIATGIYNATNWIAHPADVALPYGVALLLKLALIAPLLALGYVNKPNRDLLPPPSLQVERGRLSVLD
ncbi:MAG: CopD family protein, partial [Chloroflexota bacterium]|nr:CopD family protein [Chloroflexota bacterium]